MMTFVPVLIGSLIVSVTFLLRAEFVKKTNQIYVLKPLSTMLVVATIVLSFFLEPVGNGYKLFILVGMLLCLGGDIALMFDSAKAFKAGLVFFLLGHVVYTAAFLFYSGFLWFGIVETPIVFAISLAVFLYLYSGLSGMKIPVLFYVIVITLMVNSALLSFRADFFSSSQAWLLAFGAILFYLSDVILAVNKFKRPFALNRISLAFYFSGQMLIALSTHYMVAV